MWFITPLFYPQKMYLSSHKFPWNKKLPPTANLWDQASNASFLVGSWNPEFYWKVVNSGLIVLTS